MATPDHEAIDTFMGITGASESIAIQKLAEHAGNLNQAIDAYFSEGDRSIMRESSAALTQYDLMDVDDPIQIEPLRPPFSLLPSARNLNPFSLFSPSLSNSIFDRDTGSRSGAPFVSHPREVREIPIEVKDGNENSSHSVLAPNIQDVTGTTHEHGPEIHGTVTLDEEDDEDIPTTRAEPWNEGNDSVLGGHSHVTKFRPSAPGIDDIPVYGDDIEEEMIRAAIEASKKDTEIGYLGQSHAMSQQRHSHLEDSELAHAVSLSLKTAEHEKALRGLIEKVGPPESEVSKSTEMKDLGRLESINGRSEVGRSYMPDEIEDVEEQPLIRHRSRPLASGSLDTYKETGDIKFSPPTSPPHDSTTQRQHSNNDVHLDEWGGISSVEHEEAVMLEAALFGETPEGSAYHVPYAPYQFRQNGLDGTMGSYPQPMPRPPSPGLTSQRLIREQQDDEYLASLQTDREKELKAREEAETRRLKEQAAREATLEEERYKKEESRRKLEEEQEMERQLAAKEASLPPEPSSEDDNAITLLVRMPDGSRRGRRFLKSHKLQDLFDFIDINRVVKPGTYRLVRPYPRRTFSDGESAVTFNELGISSRQEALFLEFI